MTTWNWRKVLWVPTSWSLPFGQGGWWRAAANLGAERRSSEASASLACWQHNCPDTPGLGSVWLRKGKGKHAPNIHPNHLAFCRARLGRGGQQKKYPCWFWNVFCDVESWSIKSHRVCLNFINTGLSFFGWIFLSFKPQNAVPRNTGLGRVEAHCAKLNRWFWQDNLGSESSFPAWRPLLWQTGLQHRAHLVPQGIHARLTAVPPVQGMDAVVSDLPPAPEPGSVRRKPLHDGLQETPS